MRVCGDIIIFGHPAQKHIAHAPARQKCGISVVAQLLYYLYGRILMRHLFTSRPICNSAIAIDPHFRRSMTRRVPYFSSSIDHLLRSHNHHRLIGNLTAQQFEQTRQAANFRQHPCSLAYGGSTNTRSNLRSSRLAAPTLNAFARSHFERSSNRPFAIFFLSISTTCWSCSTKTTCSAPRLKHSSPIEPVPQNRSATHLPSIAPYFCKILNMDSLTRSVTGRVPSVSGLKTSYRVFHRR